MVAISSMTSSRAGGSGLGNQDKESGSAASAWTAFGLNATPTTSPPYLSTNISAVPPTRSSASLMKHSVGSNPMSNASRALSGPLFKSLGGSFASLMLCAKVSSSSSSTTLISFSNCARIRLYKRLLGNNACFGNGSAVRRRTKAASNPLRDGLKKRSQHSVSNIECFDTPSSTACISDCARAAMETSRFRTTAPGPLCVSRIPLLSCGVTMHIAGAVFAVLSMLSISASLTIPSGSNTTGSNQMCDANRFKKRKNATSRDIGGKAAPGLTNNNATRASIASSERCGENMCDETQRLMSCVERPYIGNLAAIDAINPA
mmetsp:Transcript_3802/g.14617  ORF Transcript_3802/g.14617 Transcript_3802/m.14617 type:complete len:318 (+) Transcript_3802:104-1057(+)